MRVVATAGHVDHGKSSLVLALTGTDPDRWPEEKTRGLTIDLGFAFTTLPSGQELGFVDVPGHVRFLKNMLAGVGAVEAAILVVAATEGWMPQSEEHLRILDLLGISHGLAVISKADLVDDDLLGLARLEVEERLAEAASFTPTEVLAVDSRSGRGLPELRLALDAMLASAPLAADRGRPRLWVDRVFAAKGAGTVVTGTMAGGTLPLDAEVVVLPGRKRARVRKIESHHTELAEAGPGRRVALNLAGVDHSELARGSALVLPDHWAATAVVDAALTALPDAELRQGAYKAYIGSGEHDVRLRLITSGRGAAAGPAPLYGRLRLESDDGWGGRGPGCLPGGAGPAGGGPAAAGGGAPDPCRAALAAPVRDRAAGRRRPGRGEAAGGGPRAIGGGPSGRRAPRGRRDPRRRPPPGPRAHRRASPSPPPRAGVRPARPGRRPRARRRPGPGRPRGHRGARRGAGACPPGLAPGAGGRRAGGPAPAGGPRRRALRPPSLGSGGNLRHGSPPRCPVAFRTTKSPSRAALSRFVATAWCRGPAAPSPRRRRS